MTVPSPTYQSTAAGTSLSPGDTVWIFVRHESPNSYPRTPTLTYLDFYIKATQPVPGTDTPVLSHIVSAGQAITELAVFADGVDSRIRSLEFFSVPVSSTTPAANNLGATGSPIVSTVNRDKTGVVYLGTDNISDRDDNGLL